MGLKNIERALHRAKPDVKVYEACGLFKDRSVLKIISIETII